VAVQPDGSISTWTVDLELPVYRDELLASRNRIPFSAGGHTLSFYGQLADGWTTTPVGTPTDLYMWQKFLRHPACRFRSGRTPTVVVFPSPERGHMTAAERLQELQTWTSRIGDERAVVSLDEEILAQKVREAAELEGRMLQAAQQGGLLWRDSLLQVFFPSPAGHNENDSARFTVPFGRWHKIALAFPYPRSEVPVRIDPTLHPGLVQLAWITLYNADGSVLWQCAEQNSHQLTVAGTAIPMSIGRLVQILSTGNDPQILLPPMATPGEPQEVRLELMVRLDAGVERLVDLLSAYLQMQEPSGPAPPPP